jgi:hypothetical protein
MTDHSIRSRRISLREWDWINWFIFGLNNISFENSLKWSVIPNIPSFRLVFWKPSHSRGKLEVKDVRLNKGFRCSSRVKWKWIWTGSIQLGGSRCRGLHGRRVDTELRTGIYAKDQVHQSSLPDSQWSTEFALEGPNTGLLLTMRRWSSLQLEPTCHRSKRRMLASNFRLDKTKKTTGITYPQHNQSYNGEPASKEFRRGLLAHNHFPHLGSRSLQSVCWGRFWIITGGKVRR